MLFIHLLIALAAGMLCGIFTGLMPGIHVNLVVTLLLASSALFLEYTSPLVLCVFIIALSITHIFLDFIPSIFLGAPDSSTVLSVLPGHRYLLSGNGLMAVKLSLVGGFFGLLFGLAFLFPLLKLFPLLYPFVKEYMVSFLLLIILAMVLQNTRKLWAIFVFLLAGVTGLFVFSLPTLSEPLFPLLTGLFGTSTLLLSLKEHNTLPLQWDTQLIDIDKTALWKALLAGQFSAVFMSLFPGLSPAIAALFGMQLTRNNGDHGYMLLQGCINTVGFLFSVAALYTIHKARNGAVVGVQTLLGSITLAELFLFVCIALITAALAVPLTLFFGRIFCKLMTHINYQKMTIGILCCLVVLTFLLSGWIGLLVLLTATAIGIIPGIVKVTRTQAMGCLLLPVLVYYL